MDGVESAVPGHQVKLYQNAPESDCMVGKPAEGEGSHQDRNRTGYHSAGCPATVEACITADSVEKPAAAGS